MGEEATGYEGPPNTQREDENDEDKESTHKLSENDFTSSPLVSRRADNAPSLGRGIDSQATIRAPDSRHPAQDVEGKEDREEREFLALERAELTRIREERARARNSDSKISSSSAMMKVGGTELMSGDWLSWQGAEEEFSIIEENVREVERAFTWDPSWPYSEFLKWKMEKIYQTISQTSIDSLLFKHAKDSEEVQKFDRDGEEPDEQVQDIMSRWQEVNNENKNIFDELVELTKTLQSVERNDRMCIEVLNMIKKRTMTSYWFKNLVMMRVWPLVYVWALDTNLRHLRQQSTPEQWVLGKRWSCFRDPSEQMKQIKQLMGDQTNKWGDGGYLYEEKRLSDGSVLKKKDQKHVGMGWFIDVSDEISWLAEASTLAYSLTERRRVASKAQFDEQQVIRRVLEATDEQTRQTAKEIIPQYLKAEAEKLQIQAGRLQGALDSSFQSVEDSVKIMESSLRSDMSEETKRNEDRHEEAAKAREESLRAIQSELSSSLSVTGVHQRELQSLKEAHGTLEENVEETSNIQTEHQKRLIGIDKRLVEREGDIEKLSKEIKGFEEKTVKVARAAVDVRLERATENIEKESAKVLTSFQRRLEEEFRQRREEAAAAEEERERERRETEAKLRADIEEMRKVSERSEESHRKWKLNDKARKEEEDRLLEERLQAIEAAAAQRDSNAAANREAIAKVSQDMERMERKMEAGLAQNKQDSEASQETIVRGLQEDIDIQAKKS